MRVGQVNLDKRNGDSRQRIAQGHTGMGKRRGINQHEGSPIVRSPLHTVDQFGLGIGLKRAQRMATLAHLHFDLGLDLGQGGGAVHRRLAGAEKVQVGSVE